MFYWHKCLAVVPAGGATCQPPAERGETHFHRRRCSLPGYAPRLRCHKAAAIEAQRRARHGGRRADAASVSPIASRRNGRSVITPACRPKIELDGGRNPYRLGVASSMCRNVTDSTSFCRGSDRKQARHFGTNQLAVSRLPTILRPTCFDRIFLLPSSYLVRKNAHFTAVVVIWWAPMAAQELADPSDPVILSRYIKIAPPKKLSRRPTRLSGAPFLVKRIGIGAVVGARPANGKLTSPGFSDGSAPPAWLQRHRRPA